jgi:TonB family protein
VTAALVMLAAFSVQVACVVAVALAIGGLARVRWPHVLLAHYQFAAATALVIPLLSTLWPSSAIVVPTLPMATFVASASAVADGTPPLLLLSVGWGLLIGTALRLCWFLVCCWRLRAMRIRGRQLDIAATIFGRIEDTVGVRATWVETGAVRAPATYGWRRPIVLVPAGLTADTDANRMMFAHELTHVRRHDWLFVMAEELVGTLLWFHPGVWLLRDRLHLYREQVVDRETIAVMGRPDVYALALVEGASLPASVESPVAPAWLTARHLRARIVALAETGGPMSRTHTRIWRAGMAAAIALTSVTVARAVPLVPIGTAQSENVYLPQDPGITLPKTVKSMPPRYTEEAMKAKIEGVLVLSTVVQHDGSVGHVEVLNSLDQMYGLDLEGIAAVKQWTFEPGTKNGKPVNVKVSIEMRFALK